MSQIARRMASLQWSPRRANPYAWWDAEDVAQLSLSGAAVAAAADLINGFSAAQAFGSARPTWSASSFNGRPGLAFDGSDDQLTYASTVGIPTGATPFEVWAVFDQNVGPGDTTNNTIIGWGASGGAARFELLRSVIGGVNRAFINVGNGTTNVQVANAAVDFSGRHVLRAVVNGTTARVDVDGVASTVSSVVPALGTTRLVLGATAAPSSFGQGIFSAGLIAPLLDSGDAGRMYAYFNRRL